MEGEGRECEGWGRVGEGEGGWVREGESGEVVRHRYHVCDHKTLENFKKT